MRTKENERVVMSQYLPLPTLIQQFHHIGILFNPIVIIITPVPIHVIPLYHHPTSKTLKR